jgi:hypothetical protein
VPDWLNTLRRRLLAVLAPTSRGIVLAVWALVFGVVLLGMLLVAFVAPLDYVQGGDPSRFARNLPGAASGEMTSAERKLLYSLSFLQQPLGYVLPPAQAIAAPRNSWRLGGFKPQQAPIFDTATGILMKLPRSCDGRATAGDLGTAEANLETLMKLAGGNRAVLHYHQGLIELCRSPGSAVKEFSTANDNLSLIDPNKQAGDDVRRYWEYHVVINYGWGLAILASGGSFDAAKKYFDDAIDAAEKVRSFRPPGPFVSFAAASRDFFNFSTADIFNAEVFALLKQHEPCAALALKQNLPAQLAYVEHAPALAANLAAAGMLCDRTEIAVQLFAAVRQDLENAASAGSSSADWRNSLALPRLAALAATSSTPIYVDADRDWWPATAESTDLRTSFETRLGKSDASWFESINLPDSDSEKVDLWLWIRRERSFLASGRLADFEQDADRIDQLGPFDRDFMTSWRQEEAGRYASALLERADVVRRTDGMAEAKPLLEFIASPGMPFLDRVAAREILWSGKSVAGAMAWQLVILLGLAVVALLHFALRAGYARTFTTRHKDHRSSPAAPPKAGA